MIKQILLLLVCLVSVGYAYTLDGAGGVYWENAKGKISVYPANITDITNPVYVNFTNYQGALTGLNFTFDFDTDNARPTSAYYWRTNSPHIVPIYGNVTRELTDPITKERFNQTNLEQTGTQTVYYDDWYPIGTLFTKTKTGDVVSYSIAGINFAAGETKQLLAYITVTPNKKGKYNLTIYDDGVKIVDLDPWFAGGYNYMTHLIFSCPGYCDNDIATPVLIANTTIMQHVKADGSDLRYVVNCSGVLTERGLWIQNITAGTNASLWVNYTNNTACSHHLWYNNSGASTVSNEINVFAHSDQFTSSSFNSTKWSVSASSPYQLGNGWIENSATGGRNYVYLNGNLTGNWTIYFEKQYRATVGKEDIIAVAWASGAVFRSFYIDPIGIGGGTRTVNSYSNNTGGFYQNGSMVTTLGSNYLFQMVNLGINGAGGKFNLSRQEVPVESLGTYQWTPYNETIIAMTGDTPLIAGTGGAAGNNVSTFWAGITWGVRTPFLTTSTAFTEEFNGSATITASSVTLLNGTTGTAPGTSYAGNPAVLNASGICSTTDSSTPFIGNFTFYKNSTQYASYLTYNWVANATNKTNTTVGGGNLYKSDTWKVGLICYNSSMSSLQVNSTAITINNTAPTISGAQINATTYGYTNNSLLYCGQTGYTDADGDTINATQGFRWFLNDTLLSGQTTYLLNTSNSTIGANSTDRIICETIVNDTGYDMKPSNRQNSSQIIINSRPVFSGNNWCEGIGCTTITSTYANTVLNCRVNVSDIDNSTIYRTIFTYYLNGAYSGNKTVYNGANNTYLLMGSNATITGFAKSSNLICEVISFDLMANSTRLNATAITINNTAPTINTPYIWSNETSNSTYLNTSYVTCGFGGYSDVDGDANGTAWYKWYKNGAEYIGIKASFINFTTIVNTTAGDAWNCSVNQEDSGYDIKNSSVYISPQIIITSNVTTITTLTNCSSGFKVLEFGLWDEETNASLNGTFEMTFTVWNTNLTNSTNTSFIFTNQHNVSICITPYAAQVYIDSFQNYYSNLTLATYPQRSYFLLKANVTTAAPQIISLYLENSTYATATTVTVKDNANKPVQAAYVAFNRYYPGTGEYRLVAMTKTNTEGVGTTYLRPRDPYYKTIVYYENGTILQMFTPAFIPCDPGLSECSLTLQITAQLYGYLWSYYGSIATTCAYSNLTGAPIFSCTFLDSSGLTRNFTLLVSHFGTSGLVQDCTNTTTGTSGTLACWLPSLPTAEFQYSLTANINPGIVLQTGSFIIGRAVTFGLFGIFLTGLIVVTLAFVGISIGSPPIIVGLTTIGVIVSAAMGLIVVSTTAIVGFVIIAIILIFSMRRS